MRRSAKSFLFRLLNSSRTHSGHSKSFRFFLMATSLLSLCFAASRKRSYQKEEAGYIYIYLRTWFFKARSSRIYSKYAVGLTWEISTLRNNPPSPANQAPFELVPFPMMLQEWDGFHPASWIRQKLLHYRM